MSTSNEARNEDELSFLEKATGVSSSSSSSSHPPREEKEQKDSSTNNVGAKNDKEDEDSDGTNDETGDYVEFIAKENATHYLCVFTNGSKAFCSKKTFKEDNTQYILNLYDRCKKQKKWFNTWKQFTTREEVVFQFLKQPKNATSQSLSGTFPRIRVRKATRPTRRTRRTRECPY